MLQRMRGPARPSQRTRQTESPWRRRTKVPLGGITKGMVQAVLAQADARLEASLAGTHEDGSPTCATQPFAAEGAWHPVRRRTRAAT